MDQNTTYVEKNHVITDPLGLRPGDLLEGDLFPDVESA